MSEYQISVDDIIFFIDVIHYSPAVKGEKSYNSCSDRDYIGYDAEVLWEATSALQPSGEESVVDIDHYSKQITEKLLDILSELSENSRQEELERVIDMEKYWKYY